MKRLVAMGELWALRKGVKHIQLLSPYSEPETGYIIYGETMRKSVMAVVCLKETKEDWLGKLAPAQKCDLKFILTSANEVDVPQVPKGWGLLWATRLHIKTILDPRNSGKPQGKDQMLSMALRKFQARCFEIKKRTTKGVQ